MGEDGKKHQPIMIHRVVFGSIERFIGILIEHYAGKFPVWLAPVQVKVLSVSEHFNAYAGKVTKKLQAQGVRVELDDRNEKLGYKIRQAQMEKVPFMVIIGEKEQESKTISVRRRDKKETSIMNVQEMVETIRRETV